jgi:hypothetical protein
MRIIGKPWYRAAYRRAVIDMHIPDWDERFLSQFNVNDYVERLKTARAQSIVAYAQSHVGLFNYPTKVGQQHRGLKGRDILREIIDGCHNAEIAVVVYVSLIFDRWAADHHDDWRMIMHNGVPFGKGDRHGLSCPNSPYRDYVRAWVEEIAAGYDFEGMRFDMTFWPGVCYCKYCAKRFAEEVGDDLPRTVNWLDERWVAFQRKREQWLTEFAALATAAVRKNKPESTVEHQSSTIPLPWTFGISSSFTTQMDFMQGDFYGDSSQGSFVRKLLEELTPNGPAGFETSFSVNLQDHTAMKSEALLECKASAAIADACAFIFIDAIDPIGTLNPLVYERMGRVFDRLMPYYPHLGGERVRDIGVYYSLESKIDFAANGKGVGDGEAAADAHTSSVLNVTRRVISHHLPFGMITRKSLARLSDHRVIVLSNVCMMNDDEVEAIRSFVRSGGYVLATGWTSLVDSRGRLRADFALGDVFGVKLKRPSWKPWPHYVAPTEAGKPHFGHYSAKYPAFARTIGIEVEVREGAEILATTTLPWPAPEPTQFASIHSNPPWQPTTRPEIVFNAFGKGKAIYCASPIENAEGLFETFVALLRRLNDVYTFEIDAPSCVEATLFHQPDRHRYLLSLVNFQKDLPNLPVDDISVRLRLGNDKMRGVTLLPAGRIVEFKEREEVVSFIAPRLKTLAMFAVDVS